MPEENLSQCRACWCSVKTYINEKGEGIYIEHVANDGPVLCEYSGMVADPVSGVTDIVDVFT